MARVFDVAHYFVQLSYSAGEPEPITTLKLQKMLYYAQGLALAKRDRQLFTDKIKAWCDGPVVPSVWHLFAPQRVIPCEATKVELDLDDRVFLRQVWKLYGKFSGDELSRMTHAEPPWKQARGGLPDHEPSDAEITPEVLRAFFTRQAIELPDVPRPVEIRRGREVYRVEDAGKVLPAGI